MPSEPENEKLSIIIDDRELRSPVAKRLYSLGVQLHSKRLDVADYIVNEDVAVERKTAADFEGSIIDGRLFYQAQGLTSAFASPLLAIIGSGFSRLSPKAIAGAQISLSTDCHLPIFRFDTEDEFANFLHILVAQKAKPSKDMALRFQKPSQTLSHRQQFIVESLPSVGPTLAKSLLKKFGSVGKVFAASLEKLQKAEGIGEKKAAAIRRAIEAPYSEESQDKLMLDD